MKLHLTTWLYHHAHWYYKWLSGYAYEMNCEIEEIREELRRTIKKLEEYQEINKLIKTHAYEKEKA